MSKVTYSSNFDSVADGEVPAGWSDIYGGWQVSSLHAVSGKAMHATDGQNLPVVLCTGGGVVADTTVLLDYLYDGSSGDIAGPMLRANAAGDLAYYWNWDLGTTMSMFCKTGDRTSYQLLAGGSAGVCLAVAANSGDIIRVEITVRGSDANTTFEVRRWNATSGARPANPDWSGAIPSAPNVGWLNSGYAGCGIIGPAGIAFDNFSVIDLNAQDTGTATPTPTPAPSQVVVDRLDAAVLRSPYSWHDDGVSSNSNSTGSYVRMGFTGTSLGFTTVDLAAGQSGYPVIRAFVDTLPHVDIPLQAGKTTYSVATGLAAGNHEVKLVAVSYDQADHYWALVSGWKLRSLLLDNGASAFPVTPRSRNGLCFFDSLGMGYELNADGTMDGTKTLPPLLGEGFDFEVGQLGYGGQGYGIAGGGQVPPVLQAYGSYSDGVSRLVGGLFYPTPYVIFEMHGTNPLSGDGVTQANIQVFLGSLRAAAPTTPIMSIVAPGGYGRAAKTAAVAAVRAGGDANVFLIDPGADFAPGLSNPGVLTEQGYDGIHMFERTNARLLARVAPQIARALAGTTVKRLFRPMA